MNTPERKLYERRCHELRVQLKEWEGNWAATHGGAKPSKTDIKNNSDIAVKYKKYQKIRDTLAGKTTPLLRPNPQSTLPQDDDLQKTNHDEFTLNRKGKRKSTDMVAGGPSPAKRNKFTQTPTGNRVAQLSVTPSISRKLFSPPVPTSIGPTPQRDGKVLGMFDLLEQESSTAVVATPSKTTGNAHPLSTPSKALEDLEEDEDKLGRTPMSSGRRNYLDMFMTPVKSKCPKEARRDSNEEGEEDDPLNDIAAMFQTPVFLKRHHPAQRNEDYKSPDQIRRPPRPMGRTLSSIVASLRQMEEDRLDEEMELLRETEIGQPTPKQLLIKSAKFHTDSEPLGKDIADMRSVIKTRDQEIPETILAKDSQTLLGGFDNEDVYDSPTEEATDRGQPLGVVKKKGQKRTTRLVKMRPVRSKRPTILAQETDPSDDEQIGVGQQENTMPDTQYDTAKENINPADEYDSLLNSGSEFASDAESPTTSKRGKALCKMQKAGIKDKGLVMKQSRGRPKSLGTVSARNANADIREGEGKVKKAVRKVNELAHANFRALKLRNKGSKAGPGYKSRFRRRN